MLDLMGAEDTFSLLRDVIERFRPSVVGIGIRNIDDQNMLNPGFFLEEDNKVVKMVSRLSDAPVVLGGAGFSIFPDAVLRYTGADMGIEGEGEETFRMLLERLERTASPDGLPGLHLREKGVQGERRFWKQLDSFPLPEPELLSSSLSRAADSWLPVQTRRGCPMGCSYCSTASVEGRAVRRRSPRKVVEWMARIAERGINQFYFVDNIFNLPASYARKLCDELMRAKPDIKWRAIIYPLRIEESLVAAMAKTGCVEASIGFESGCEHIIKAMGKRYSIADVRNAFGLFKKHGILRMGFLLLGGPGETRESVRESLEFADSLHPDFLRITIGIRIYPCTPLAEQAKREGVIDPGDDLLFPRFYMAPGLDPWLGEEVTKYVQDRPYCFIDK